MLYFVEVRFVRYVDKKYLNSLSDKTTLCGAKRAIYHLKIELSIA